MCVLGLVARVEVAALETGEFLKPGKSWILTLPPQRKQLCAHAFLMTQTAVANGRSKNDERLARWLLMADDRIDGHDPPLAHKFLATCSACIGRQ